MFVLCQYYAHRDPARAAEYEYCLRDTIRNGHHLVLFEEHPAPEDIRKGAAHCIPYPQRITFAYAMQWANQNLPPGSVAAIINLDIMIRFNAEAVQAHFQQYPQHFLCLSRREFDPTTQQTSLHPGMEQFRYMNCQDGWVFRTPTTPFTLADFSVGNCPGCDNAIAFRAAEAGLIPINLGDTFPIWHLDRARAKNPVSLMTKDATTSMVIPQKHGRLFLPRTAVGNSQDVSFFLQQARTYALAQVEQQGYSQETDARMTALLATLTASRLAQPRWDLQYLLSCLALNITTFLNNNAGALNVGGPR